ncbi:MAG: hypothetical protein K0Q74_1014, partial [Gammaproteobacteria bacterium]|nr:hypothetical protein [Gammaproteobacteria bacterium]
KAAEEREEPRTESDKYPLGKTVAGRVRAIATFFWQNGLLRGQPDELRLALVGLIISQRSVEAANLGPGNFWNQAREDKLASLLNELKVKNKAGRCLNNDLEFQKDFLEKLAPLFTPADILRIIKQISALQLSQTVLRQIYSDAIASSEKQNAKAIDWLSNISNRVFGGQEVVELLGEDLDLGTGDDAFAGARSRRPSEGNRGEEDSNDGDAFAGARRPLLTVWQRTKNSQTSSVATARSARMLSPPSLRMPEERRPLISHESSKSDGSATIISSNG